MQAREERGPRLLFAERGEPLGEAFEVARQVLNLELTLKSVCSIHAPYHRREARYYR